MCVAHGRRNAGFQSAATSKVHGCCEKRRSEEFEHRCGPESPGSALASCAPVLIATARDERLDSKLISMHSLRMGLPTQPITLSVQELADLNQKLAHLRHDLNNNLSLMVAAVELIRHKPQMADKMLVTLGEQPPKMSACLNKFSLEFERALGITRP